jgi:hypothetical protein
MPKCNFITYIKKWIAVKHDTDTKQRTHKDLQLVFETLFDIADVKRNTKGNKFLIFGSIRAVIAQSV